MAKGKKRKQSHKGEPKARDREKGRGGGAKPVLKKRRGTNWMLLAPALAGMALTAYLAQVTLSGAELPFCTEGSACDVVQQSRWGNFFGIPTSLLGFGAYFALAWVALRVRGAERHWKFSWGISLLGLAFSVYLTAISVWVLEATCLYCLASLGLMTLIFVVVIAQRPAGLAGFNWGAWSGQTALVALALVGGMHLYYSGWIDPATGPEEPYLQGLATHLAKRNAIFYGAFW